MKGFYFDLQVCYFATFRKVTSTSLILSYSLPPFTTVRGMLSNALGFERDNLTLQDSIQLGIKILNSGEKNREFAKILKLKVQPGHRLKDYPSAPMFREFLVQPAYRIFLGGDEKIINNCWQSLQDPCRPLYLGQSDDLVSLEVSELIDIQINETEIVHSITSDLLPGAEIEKLPYKFEQITENKFNLEYKIVSVFENESLLLPQKRKLHQFGDQYVDLL